MHGVSTIAGRKTLAGALVALAAVVALLATSSAVDAGGAATAQDELAQILGVFPEEVLVIRIEQVIWDDACMGLAESDEVCGAALGGGNVVWLAYDGDGYRYHTEARGTSFRLAAGPFAANEILTAPLPATARLDPALIGTEPPHAHLLTSLPNTGSGGVADEGGGGAAAWVWASIGAAMVVVGSGAWKVRAR